MDGNATKAPPGSLPRVVNSLLLVAALGLMAMWWTLTPAHAPPAPALVEMDAPPTADAENAPAVKDHGAPALPPPIDDDSLPDVVQVTTDATLIDGVPAAVTVRAGEHSFNAVLTGKFARKRKLLFIPVQLYTISNYLCEPSQGTEDELLANLLRDGPVKVYLLRFDMGLSAAQIQNAINEEIEQTFVDVDMQRMGPAIDQFVQQFGNGARKGDTVAMAWLPGGRLYTAFNSPEAIGLLARDVPLARAVWRIWAGVDSGPERAGLVERFAKPAGRAKTAVGGRAVLR